MKHIRGFTPPALKALDANTKRFQRLYKKLRLLRKEDKRAYELIGDLVSSQGKIIGLLERLFNRVHKLEAKPKKVSLADIFAAGEDSGFGKK